MPAKVLKDNGGRWQDRTADPYDVNVVRSTAIAESCGFFGSVSGNCGNMFAARSQRLAHMNQSALRFAGLPS